MVLVSVNDSNPGAKALCTCIDADEGSLVEVVTAAYGPAAVRRTKHLQPHPQPLLHHTVLTAALFTAAPRAALEQPVGSQPAFTRSSHTQPN